MILAGDKRDQLGDALLDSLLGILGNFSIRWDGHLHDPRDIGDRQQTVLLTDILPSKLILAGKGVGWAGAICASLFRGSALLWHLIC